MIPVLPDSEIRNLAEILPERTYLTGKILMEEGGSSEKLLILLDEEVEIIKALGSSEECQLIEWNASGRFNTMLYGIIDFDTRPFTYARAGQSHRS